MIKLTFNELKDALACIPEKSANQDSSQYEEELKTYLYTLGALAWVSKLWDEAEHILEIFCFTFPNRISTSYLKVFYLGFESTDNLKVENPTLV